MPSLRDYLCTWFVMALPKACLEGWAMTSAHLLTVPIPRIPSAEAMLSVAKSQYSSKLTSVTALCSLGEVSLRALSWNQAQPLGILWSSQLVYPFSWVSFLGPDPAWPQHPCFPTLDSATKAPERFWSASPQDEGIKEVSTPLAEW